MSLMQYIKKSSDDELEILHRKALSISYKADKNPRDLIEAVMMDESGVRLNLEPIHLAWHNFIKRRRAEGFNRILLLAPRGTGKTVNIAIGFVLHMLAQNPNLRIKIVCNSDMNAEARVTTIQRYIAQSDEYHFATNNKVNMDKLEKCTAHEFFLTRDSMSIDPSVQAKGINTGGTSGRADVLLYDDPL